jgi:membrane-bound ClpP family serine protease
LWLRVIAAMSAFMAIVSVGAATAQDTSSSPEIRPAELVSIPAARQADRVAVITVEGAIDQITAVSVERRIREAEEANFDAIVLEVNSPGGMLMSCVEISAALKASSIKNTVAWVNPEAHSGGAIISLACREIVTSDPSSFGDALIVLVDMFGLQGMQTLTPGERTKMLPYLMTEIVDSARRNGYDEYLVQAIVTDGIELWQVEDVETGARLAINEGEYRMLFDGEPERGRPMLAQVTGGVQTYVMPKEDAEVGPDDELGAVENEEGSDEVKDEDEAGVGGVQGVSDLPASEEEDLTAYRPASDTLADVDHEIRSPSEDGVEYVFDIESERVIIRPSDKGRYRLVGYICDGSSAIVMRTRDMDDFGLSSGTIQDDQELKAFFGATTLARTNENVFEKIVRFLTNPLVKVGLIAVFLLALGVEMLTGGTGIAGAIALAALVMLLGANSLIGLSGWWELIAIVAGIICLAIELLILPGFGVFGVLGFMLVFVGLVGTFVSASGPMAPVAMQQQLGKAVLYVVMALITVGFGWWMILRKGYELPIIQKMVLNDVPAIKAMNTRTLLHAITPDDGEVRIGFEGVTTTPLMPIGQADIHDVHAAFGTIDRGVRVRVVSSTKMRIEVEEIVEDVHVAPGEREADTSDGSDEGVA